MIFHNSKMLILTGISILVILSGCNSTPYRDDYARHVNTMDKPPMEKDRFHITFSDGEQVDLRALYDNDTTMGNSSIMYQGGAGLVGLIAQIGIHSSMVSSEREERLANLQASANSHIQPLIALSNQLTLSQLLHPKHQTWLTVSSEPAITPLHVKPIFFSNKEMTQFSVKVVAWIPDPKGTKKRPNKYKNLIQVVNAPLSTEQHSRLVQGDQMALKGVLSDLLATALSVTHNATTGKFSNVNGATKTFKMPGSESNKIFRASKIADTCEHIIVRNLRQWLIAIPKETTTDAKPIVKQAQSIDSALENTASTPIARECTIGA